jgi:hypothetical protein
MKKTTTSNPLKFFNDAKEARNKSFNKSLPKKGEGGRAMGPMTQQEAAQAAFASSQNNAMTSGEGPRVYSPTPTWSSQAKELASKGVSEIYKPNNILDTNVERANAIIRNTPRGVPNSLPKVQQQEEINRMNTTPKTGIPVSPEYKPNEYEYINNKGAKNGGMMKKGGTHKMPNGKVMLNSKMKKSGVIKSKKK